MILCGLHRGDRYLAASFACLCGRPAKPVPLVYYRTCKPLLSSPVVDSRDLLCNYDIICSFTCIGTRVYVFFVDAQNVAGNVGHFVDGGFGAKNKLRRFHG